MDKQGNCFLELAVGQTYYRESSNNAREKRMNQWGQSCQVANQTLQNAVDAMGDLMTCFQREIDGRRRISTETTRQMGDSLYELSDALQKLTTVIGGVADAHSRALLSFLGGKRLDREQFYILLATGCVEWTNKTVGLSEFDDFDLFDLLRYETAGQNGYIYLAPDIDNLPAVEPDDWTLAFMSRTYRRAIIAPEAIQWSTLSPRQCSFFETYLPEVVDRFIHGKPPVLLPGTTTQVDMKELVSALKKLKVHLKARRKLEVLVRNSDHEGELVLELSGRSKFAGFLTTIRCAGDWKTETLVPAASFRGFVAHPPDDETSYMSFEDGRLHIGGWNCPARVANDS